MHIQKTFHTFAYNYIQLHTIKYGSMATATLVQARIDSVIKEKAESYFRSFGMDNATAIKIFYAKVAESGSIPFTIGRDAEDLYDAKIAEQAYEEYLANGKKSRPFSELLKEIDL